jgi:hypothetical protein
VVVSLTLGELSTDEKDELEVVARDEESGHQIDAMKVQSPSYKSSLRNSEDFFCMKDHCAGYRLKA